MINIYHRGFLPKGVEPTKLIRWPFVYLHGAIEAPTFVEDAPDIFHADISLELIDDGITECQVHINEKITKAEAYIWSRGEVYYRRQLFGVKEGRRQGLIIDPENMKDWEFAYNHYNKQAQSY